MKMKTCYWIFCLAVLAWVPQVNADGALRILAGGHYASDNPALLVPETGLALDYDLFLPLNNDYTLIGAVDGATGYQAVVQEWYYTYLAKLEFSRVWQDWVFKPVLQTSGELIPTDILTGPAAPDYLQHLVSLDLTWNKELVALYAAPAFSWVNGETELGGQLEGWFQLSDLSILSIGLITGKTVFWYTYNDFNITPILTYTSYALPGIDLETSLAFTWQDSDYTSSPATGASEVEILDYHDLAADITLSTYIGDLVLDLVLPVSMRWKRYDVFINGAFAPEKEWIFTLNPQFNLNIFWQHNMAWEILFNLEKSFSNSPDQEQLGISLTVHYEWAFN